LIYVGIPVHNERHTAGVLLWRIRKVMLEEGMDFRLLVVDDASTDGTDEVLEPYGRVLPLKVIRHETRQGYAASLERVVREVLGHSGYHKRDALLTLQADFTDAPEAIPAMLRSFQSGADLVAGRLDEPRALPRAVRLGRTGARWLSGSLPVPAEIDDPLSGFRLYRLFVLQRALEELGPDDRLLRHDGWAANAELLALAWPHVRQAEQVDFSPDYRRRYRESRFNLLSQLWDVFRAGRDDRLRERRVAAGSGSEA
jgi:glycosyltransferase involved in cell wall biosynthesis